MDRHLTREHLAHAVIDSHAHLGVSLKAYACLEYPYAQSLEDLYYRQRAGRVDAAIVFPFSPDLFFDPRGLTEGVCKPADDPVSPAPYALENRLLMREIFSYFPELAHRFLPFVSVDPGRMVARQLAELEALAAEYPIYGMKIVPVFCQSPVTALLEEGRPLLEFARARNLPILLHTTADPREAYSTAALAFQVIEANPDLRFCLAHCIGFHRGWLERADALPNVFVDTAALKIQVQLALEDSEIMAAGADRFPADYTDHRRVMRALAVAYPRTLLWGTDAPAYAYFARRVQSEAHVVTFALRARYEDETAALRALSARRRRQVSRENTLRFLFGE